MTSKQKTRLDLTTLPHDTEAEKLNMNKIYDEILDHYPSSDIELKDLTDLQTVALCYSAGVPMETSEFKDGYITWHTARMVGIVKNHGRFEVIESHEVCKVFGIKPDVMAVTFKKEKL